MHDEETVKPEEKRVAPIEVERTLLVALLGCGLLCMLVAITVWMQHDLDRAVLTWSAGARENAVIVQLAHALTRYGMALIAFGLLAYMATTYLVPSLADTRRLFVVVLLSFVVIGLGGDLLKEVIRRSRPSIENASDANVKAKDGSSSFPSGHATKSLALAVPFVIFVPNRRRWIVLLKSLLLLVALSVCLSRMLLARHYLSDVLGASGLVLLLLPVVVLAGNRILTRIPVEKLGRATIGWTVALLVVAVLLLLV
jgi:undecaprenyl-diphosphatase